MIKNGSEHIIPVYDRPTSEALGNDSVSWLQQLQHACWIDIPGRDTRRHRIITTLLHGNEPSGLIALHRWLQSPVTPAVNVSILIASVEAALFPPLFSHRMIPGERDLNRCFKAPFDDKPGELARQVLERIRELKPECIIDIHNTSGSGPSFAVSVADQFEQRALARYFCRRMIVTELRLGSLMEVKEGCPTITIECGGAKDVESEEAAFNGINEVAQAHDLFEAQADKGLEVLHEPIRIELKPGVTVAYSEHLLEEVDITLLPDIEHCNYGMTSKERCLGWVGEQGLTLLRANDNSGNDQLHKLLREEKGWLYPATDLHIFMATTSAVIAKDDCLFYAVAEGEVEINI